MTTRIEAVRGDAVLLILLLLAAVLTGQAAGTGARGAQAIPAQAAPTTPALNLAQWESDIRAFEDADRAHPRAPGGILFVGSSSIRMWTTLREDFPGLPVLNRGFGGSQIREVTAFTPRIVLPYTPKLIVFYCGTNDI